MKTAIDKNESEFDRMKRQAEEWLNKDRNKTAPPFLHLALRDFKEGKPEPVPVITESYPVIAVDDIDVETVKRWFQLFMGFDNDSRMKDDIRALARASHLNRHLNWDDASQFLSQRQVTDLREELIKFCEQTRGCQLTPYTIIIDNYLKKN